MRILIWFRNPLFILISSLLMVGSVSAQESTIDEKVYYISFNALKTEGGEKKVFRDYIKKLTPIMRKYNMSLAVMEVMDLSNGSIPGDFITSGSAPTIAAMQGFFADPDFQNIFPTLVGIIDEHEVIFVDKDITIDTQVGEQFLFSAGFDGAASCAATGLSANKGLAENIQSVAGPSWLAIKSCGKDLPRNWAYYVIMETNSNF